MRCASHPMARSSPRRSTTIAPAGEFRARSAIARISSRRRSGVITTTSAGRPRVRSARSSALRDAAAARLDASRAPRGTRPGSGCASAGAVLRSSRPRCACGDAARARRATAHAEIAASSDASARVPRCLAAAVSRTISARGSASSSSWRITSSPVLSRRRPVDLAEVVAFLIRAERVELVALSDDRRVPDDAEPLDRGRQHRDLFVGRVHERAATCPATS